MMLKAIGKNTKTVYLVLGFIGGDDGPVRAVVLDPVKGGRASVANLHDLEFEPLEKPPEPSTSKRNGTNPGPPIFDENPWGKKKK